MQKLDMIIDREKSFNISESYKVIRSNLMFLGGDIKTIMLTSTIMGEGKSTVSWNLALSIADSGKRVLYIDADMRKSVFIGRYHVRTKTRGLSHFLSGQAELEDIIFATPADGLFVIPTGIFPPNPSELLSRDIFGKMIEALKADFDYILIDTPPLMSAIDAAIVSAVCDGSIIVVCSNKVSGKVINNSIAQLKKTGKPILGAIINKVNYKDFPSGLRKHYAVYYDKYYGHYSANSMANEEE